MASVSFSAARGQVFKVEDITVGTDAPSTGDVELSIDQTKSLNKQEVIDIVKVFLRRLEDGRFEDLLSI